MIYYERLQIWQAIWCTIFFCRNETMRSQRHAFIYKSAKWRVSGPQRKLEESGLVSRVRLCVPGEIQLIRGPRVNRRVMPSTMPLDKAIPLVQSKDAPRFNVFCIDLPMVGIWLWEKRLFAYLRPHLVCYAMRSTPNLSTRKLADSNNTRHKSLRIITEQGSELFTNNCFKDTAHSFSSYEWDFLR